jgi:hypothetical protein
MTDDATTRKCGHCGKRFDLPLRSGRTRTNRKKTLHREKRYCSDTCRKLASKARRTRFKTPCNTHGIRPTSHLKAPEATTPLSTVTTATPPINLAHISGAQKATRSTLQIKFGGYTVIFDTDWPGMYRVRRPAGSLTDMANLTRARDAAQHFADQARREKPQAEAA